MNSFRSINILDALEAIGENELCRILSDFICPKNPEIEKFVRTNAIEFAKQKISITYLVMNEAGQLAAIFALAHRVVEISNEHLSNNLRRKMRRHAKLDDKTNSYMISAFLIAQFGKNYQYGDVAELSGNELMDMVMFVFKAVQREVGGGVIYLECEDKPQLLHFYQKEPNCFLIFDERYSEKEHVKYIQLMKTF